jgi:hypothetical protein
VAQGRDYASSETRRITTDTAKLTSVILGALVVRGEVRGKWDCDLCGTKADVTPDAVQHFRGTTRQTTAPLACRELGQSRCARGVERLHNPKVMSLSRARNTLCEPEYIPCRFLLGVATG